MVSKVIVQTTHNSVANFKGADWISQVFEATKDIKMSKVVLRLSKVTGNTVGDITISIRATSSGEPTGEDLVYGTIDGNALTTNEEGEIKEINMELDLVKGTSYAIVVRATDNTGYGRWRFYDNNEGYSGKYDSSDSGSTWDLIDNDRVQYFEIWGDYKASSGTKDISKRYPIKSESNVGKKINLVPTMGSLVARRKKVGL